MTALDTSYPNMATNRHPNTRAELISIVLCSDCADIDVFANNVGMKYRIRNLLSRGLARRDTRAIGTASPSSAQGKREDRSMKPSRPGRVASYKEWLVQTALGLVITAFALLIQRAIWSNLPPSPFLLVYPAVIASGWLGGWPAGLAAISTATIALPYWFLPPVDSFAIAAKRDALDLVTFCAVSILVVRLLTRVKHALAVAQAAKVAAENATIAKDTVLAIVAHDLRNPLQTIGLSADILASVVAGQGDRMETTVARIRRAAERTRTLVDNILSAANLGEQSLSVRPSIASLASVVDDSLSTLKPIAEFRSITLEVPEVETLGGSLVCDPERIVQVLSNLVGNALKYTPSGGRVSVDVRRTTEGIRFAVDDTGSGMTKDDLTHAFDRLWHGREPGHGSGLGLWIAKSFVEAHGGSIEAESRPGVGTRMSFLLPQLAPSSVLAPEDNRMKTKSDSYSHHPR